MRVRSPGLNSAIRNGPVPEGSVAILSARSAGRMRPKVAPRSTGRSAYGADRRNRTV